MNVWLLMAGIFGVIFTFVIIVVLVHICWNKWYYCESHYNFWFEFCLFSSIVISFIGIGGSAYLIRVASGV